MGQGKIAGIVTIVHIVIRVETSSPAAWAPDADGHTVAAIFRRGRTPAMRHEAVGLWRALTPGLAQRVTLRSNLTEYGASRKQNARGLFI
jgi:hypothetical protein